MAEEEREWRFLPSFPRSETRATCGGTHNSNQSESWKLAIQTMNRACLAPPDAGLAHTVWVVEIGSCKFLV